MLCEPEESRDFEFMHTFLGQASKVKGEDKAHVRQTMQDQIRCSSSAIPAAAAAVVCLSYMITDQHCVPI